MTTFSFVSNKNVFFQHKIYSVLCTKIVPLFMLVMSWEGVCAHVSAACRVQMGALDPLDPLELILGDTGAL